jgi:hypothetical protein
MQMKSTGSSGIEKTSLADEDGGSTATGRPGSVGSGNNLTRVTVNLTRKAVEAMEAVSDSTGYSKTDTINRALQVYAIIQEILDDSGGSLLIKRHENDETPVRLHIV